MEGRHMINRPALVPLVLAAVALTLSACGGSSPSDPALVGDPWYPIVDTGQTSCYDDSTEIACPAAGEAFFGQDAQSSGTQPSYTKSSDGLTDKDNVTGLTWQQGYEGPKSWTDAKGVCAAQRSAGLGGYTDWRLPTIKELYSLWNGSKGWPYLDTNYFAHPPVDSHGISWSSTKYAGQLESTGDEPPGRIGTDMAFGVNFDTGHIKAYATGGMVPTHFVRCVRGTAYGVNDFLEVKSAEVV
jgi:hypothetical protein